MAATSHDFWLKNLSPKVWKSLHMLVYVAYALLVFHVMLGVVQLEQSPAWIGLVGVGMVTVIGLHLTAGMTEKRRLQEQSFKNKALEGFFRGVYREENPRRIASKIVFFGKGRILLF